MYRSNWISFEEFERFGMPIKSTSSVQAVQLYDAAVSQSAGWYDHPQLGGLRSTLVQMAKVDPEFVLGEAFSLCMELIGFSQSYYHDPNITKRVDQLVTLTEQRRTQITRREYLHVQAVRAMSQLRWSDAASTWEVIIREECPVDFHALVMAFNMYLFTGQKDKQFDLVSFAYPHFKARTSIPNSEVIDGFYAFVLEEDGQFSQAEKYARQGLELNPYDGWTTHALAHVMEMQGRTSEALAMMSSTEVNWTRSNLLSCHNYWHYALFNLAADQLDQAVALYDQQIWPRVLSAQSSFTSNDACALLYRVSLLHPDHRPSVPDSALSERYSKLSPVACQYLPKHILPFNDAHSLMSCLGSGERNKAVEMIESVPRSKYAELYPEKAKLSVDLLQSMLDYQDGKCHQVVDRLYPNRHRFVEFGGSDAQRDVFNQLLIAATLKSCQSNQSHRKLLDQLLLERENILGNDQFVRHLQKPSSVST